MSTKTLNVLFARMNPPTVAHETLIATMADRGEDFRIFLSETVNLENPLPVDIRKSIISECHPEYADKIDSARDLFIAMDKADAYMKEHGMTNIELWFGSDRLPAFERVLLYPDRWSFKVTGLNQLNRTSDVSATAVRAAAVNNDTTTYNRMAMGTPSIQGRLFDDLRERLTNGTASLEGKTKTSKRRSNRL
ncbi:hypothetical protein D3C75_869850 [compost metagenome]